VGFQSEIPLIDIQSKSEIAQRLAKTIIDDLKRLASADFSVEQSDSGIANALRENVHRITCVSDLHDYMEANTLGETEEVWDQLTEGIGPDGDEGKVQAACDVVSEAHSIVDKWISQGELKAVSHGPGSRVP
jgi:hypothetical protein